MASLEPEGPWLEPLYALFADSLLVINAPPVQPGHSSCSRGGGGHRERAPHPAREEPQGQLRWLTQEELTRLLDAAAKSRNKELIEAELFGHEKGAFTGAARRKPGRFELADGGTLFLDEIAELPPATPAKLLRALQEREIERLGGTRPLPVDVRVIAATNQDLPALVHQRQFREDLFYRLNVVAISFPPLRERPDDIERLAAHFLEHHARQLHKPGVRFTTEAATLMQRYPWPGNVRELEHAVQRAVILARASEIKADDLGLSLRREIADDGDVSAPNGSLADMERRWVMATLERYGGNQRAAAEALGIDRSHCTGSFGSGANPRSSTEGIARSTRAGLIGAKVKERWDSIRIAWPIAAARSTTGSAGRWRRSIGGSSS